MIILKICLIYEILKIFLILISSMMLKTDYFVILYLILSLVILAMVFYIILILYKHLLYIITTLVTLITIYSVCGCRIIQITMFIGSFVLYLNLCDINILFFMWCDAYDYHLSKWMRYILLIMLCAYNWKSDCICILFLVLNLSAFYICLFSLRFLIIFSESILNLFLNFNSYFSNLFNSSKRYFIDLHFHRYLFTLFTFLCNVLKKERQRSEWNMILNIFSKTKV